MGEEENDKEESDVLWQEFVNSLNAPNVSPPVAAKDESAVSFEELDDPSDPDYNLFLDLQNLDVDEDDFNDDFNEWILGLVNEPLANIQHDSNNRSSSSIGSSSTAPSGESTDEKDQFAEQLRTLQSQLSFHVQALTQTWMLSSGSEELETLATQSKQMLLQVDEVTKAKDNSPLPGSPASSAIKLIEERGTDIERAEKRNSFNRISEFSRKLISSRRDIFKFDWAFPNVRFTSLSPSNDVKKKFILAEDFLIAIGLSECTKSKSKRIFNMAFKKMKDMKFLPSKSESTIRYRIKHLKKVLTKLHSTSEESLKQDARLMEFSKNPIICYLRNGQLPPVYSCFNNPLLDTYHKYRRPPRWFHQLAADKDEKELLIDETDTQNESNSLPKKSRLIVPKVEFCTIESSTCPTMSFSSSSMPTIIFPSIESPPSIAIDIPVKRRNTKRPCNKLPDMSSGDSAESKHKRVRFAENVQVHMVENLVHIGSPSTAATSTDTAVSDSVEILSESDKSNNGGVIEKNEQVVPVDNGIEPRSEEAESTGIPVQYNSTQTSPSDDDNQGEEDNIAEDEFVIPDNEEFIEDEEVEVEEEDDDDKLAMDEDIEVEEEGKDPMDDENDLNALMMASCTAVSNRARQSATATEGETGIVARRKSHVIARQRDSSLFILQKQIALSEQPEDEEHRKQVFVAYYLKRAQTILSPDEYVQFLQVLVTLLHDHCSTKRDSSSSSASPSVVYQHIKQFLVDLRQSYATLDSNNSTQQDAKTAEGIQELINMLILFLDFPQAEACGESFRYLHWRRVFDFLRNVELYLRYIYPKRSQQLGCIQRLIKSLNQIGQMKQSDAGQVKLKIKSVVSKVLNGHTLLVSEFSSLFLDDSPAPYLYANAEDFDEFTLPADEVNCDLAHYPLENVTVPLGVDDLKYGTSECPCKLCHSTADSNPDQSSTLNQMKHCHACSVRFIAGRLYVPQYNSSAKKTLLVEYVPQVAVEEEEVNKMETPACADSGNSNNNAVPAVPEAVEPWTMTEDRMLLEACRTAIVDSQITKLNDSLFESVAQQMASKFERRTTKELGERLRQLIEMLTNAGGKSH